jgi:hypothetical protein
LVINVLGVADGQESLLLENQNVVYITDVCDQVDHGLTAKIRVSQTSNRARICIVFTPDHVGVHAQELTSLAWHLGHP